MAEEDCRAYLDWLGRWREFFATDGNPCGAT